ncbi:MAG: SMI1/KNR4 family protein [Polyangiaceae bacterium]|nr:SMI1/KNR4 family protein [Polyangiaceae bacterium]
MPTTANDQLIKLLRERVADETTRVDMGSTQAYLPATAAAVEAAESRLGFELPSFYVRILTEVANGGFGPGYGIIGVRPGGDVDDDLGSDLVEGYLAQRKNADDPVWWWPSKLVAICNWGCATWSCLDCEHPDGRILTSESLDNGASFHETAGSLHDWLAKWAAGVQLGDDMYEVVGSRAGINPFTKQPIEIAMRRLKGETVSLGHRR